MNNDLISRSALLKELKEWYNESKQREAANYEWETFESDGIESAMLCVENSPAVDAEPMQHGEWTAYKIDGRHGLNETSVNRCSICNRYSIFAYRFCPECGAKMDGGKPNANSELHN